MDLSPRTKRKSSVRNYQRLVSTDVESKVDIYKFFFNMLGTFPFPGRNVRSQNNVIQNIEKTKVRYRVKKPHTTNKPEDDGALI